MTFTKPWTNVSEKLYASCLVFLIASAVFCQTSEAVQDQAGRPVNMLVIGDSILWGQGLKTEHKPWYHVKAWLEKTTGRMVNERVEAHLGAVVLADSELDTLTSTNREVNLGPPTLAEQVDDAERLYSDGLQVDVVLVSGCANDVGLEKFLNASTIAEVDEMTRAKCGDSNGESVTPDYDFISCSYGDCKWILSVLFRGNSTRLHCEGFG